MLFALLLFLFGATPDERDAIKHDYRFKLVWSSTSVGPLNIHYSCNGFSLFLRSYTARLWAKDGRIRFVELEDKWDGIEAEIKRGK